MSLSLRKASLGLQPGPWSLTGSMSKTKPTKVSETNASKKETKHFIGNTPALCPPRSFKNPPGCPPKFSSLSLKQWISLKERIEAMFRMGWTNQEEAQRQAQSTWKGKPSATLCCRRSQHHSILVLERALKSI